MAEKNVAVLTDWEAPISSADAARLIGVTPARLRQLFANAREAKSSNALAARSRELVPAGGWDRRYRSPPAL